MSELVVCIRPARALTVVTLSGDLDICSAPGLVRRLEGMADLPLVLDVRAVKFLDAAGLRVLLALDARLQQAGHQLVLAAVPRPVRRLLEITGTDGVIVTSPTVEDAIAHLSPTGIQPASVRRQPV